MRKGERCGTYIVGVKDLASAYVLCPHLTEYRGLSFTDGRKLLNNEGIVSRVMMQVRKQIRTELLRLIKGQVTKGLVRLQASE